MLRYIAALALSFIYYLALTAWSGGVLLWSPVELAAGLIVSAVVAVPTRQVLVRDLRMANPIRWLYFTGFLAAGFIAIARANFDVARRVITGDINPGIVRVPIELETGLGVTILGNIINLTPGTLIVDSDLERSVIYVHWIDVIEPEPESSEVVSGRFEWWAGRIAE